MNLSTSKGPRDRKLEQLKSLQKTPLRRSLNNSFIAEPPINDDENERNKRRSMAHLQRRISNACSTPINAEHPPANASAVGEYPSATEDEIKSHFDICVKMFMENKITIKNAWNIKIIDYMRTFLQSNRVNKNSLQIGSTSLDVGAKVYGIRVDDVHSTGLKLASNMSKVAQQQQNNESGDEAEYAEVLNGAKKTTKKRKFTTGGVKHTIAKDVNTLLCDVPKLDSACFQTKSNTELSMLDNFLTNRIPMDKSGCLFTLMDKERIWTTKDDSDHCLRDKTYNLKIPTINKMNICPHFCNFEVDVWDPDNDEEQQYANDTQNNGELIFDDNGIPIAELDGSVHDIFNELDNGCSEDDQEPERIPLLGDVTNISDLRPTNTLQSSDYAYQYIARHSQFMTNIWAGPSHWKFKHIQRAASRFSGAGGERKVQQKKRSKEKDIVINFMDQRMEVNEIGPKVDKKHLLKPWPESNKFCTQVNHSKVMKKLNELFTKPELIANELKCLDQENNNDQNSSFEVPAYDYENPNDANYCAARSMGDDDGRADEEEIVAVGQNQGYTGENLIDLPEMAQINTIGYATRAKRMDMKKLKGAVWKILVNDTENLVTGDIFEKKMENPMTFSDVYTKLPTVLNKSMKEELSSPLAFIAMLHLANEQNLKLTGQADLADFKIEPAVEP